MLQGHFARVSTQEGEFSSLLNYLPQDLARKYLTGLISWSILWGGNSAPEDEYYPLKSSGHTEELSSSSVPLEHNPGAKPFVCIGLYSVAPFFGTSEHIELGRVVRKPISANPGLKVNREFNFFYIKVF